MCTSTLGCQEVELESIITSMVDLVFVKRDTLKCVHDERNGNRRFRLCKVRLVDPNIKRREDAIVGGKVSEYRTTVQGRICEGS